MKRKLSQATPEQRIEIYRGQFLSAGMWSLCRQSRHITLSPSHREVLKALSAAAQHLTRGQLRVLTEAFDGMDKQGNSLIDDE